MKELSDSEFDDIFRKRVNESSPEFEEGAWDMMEKKLRRRDRIVLFRNTSAVLVFFFILVGTLYLYNKPTKEQTQVSQKKEPKETERIITKDSIINNNNVPLAPYYESEKPATAKTLNAKKERVIAGRNEIIVVTNKIATHPKSPASSADSSGTLPIDITRSDAEATASIPDSKKEDDQGDILEDEKSEGPVKIKKRNPIKFGLTLSAGPDFNSVKSIAGNKATLNAGILLDASLSSKISVSTGARYGGKSYETTAGSYGITNPELLKTITYVDGSCDVLEIPLRLSYELLNNNKNSIKLNGGLSSYLMLKEKYVFKYTPESKINDYVIEKQNANQHYFSVAEMSATYRIKSKTSKVEFGVEPYVKIPLGGVGEGNVRLKSSGITINMFYDLSKKNKQ